MDNPKNAALYVLQEDQSPFLLVFNNKNFIDPKYQKKAASGKRMGSRKQGKRKKKAEELLEDEGIANPDHAASESEEEETEDEEEDREKRDEYISLFYWRVQDVLSFGEGGWTLERLEEHFGFSPDFVRQNYPNLSYLTNGYFEAKCKPAFSLRCLLESWKNKEEGKKYTKVELNAVSSERHLAASSLTLKQHKWNHLPESEKKRFRKMDPEKQGCLCLPESSIAPKDYIGYLAALDDEAFVEFLLKQKEDFRERLSEYAISIPQIPPMMIDMMLSSALRAFKENCVDLKYDEEEKVVSETPQPLACKGSDSCSDAMRQSPHPCPAPEYDVHNALYLESSKECIKRHKECIDKLQPIPGFPSSYSDFDLTEPANAKLFTDHVLMAFAGRLTGKANVLSQFPAWRKSYLKLNGRSPEEASPEEHCPVLPTMDTLEDWLVFVDEFCAFGSQKIKKGKKNRGKSYRRGEYSQRKFKLLMNGQTENAVMDTFSRKGLKGDPRKFICFMKTFARGLQEVVCSIGGIKSDDKRVDCASVLGNHVTASGESPSNVHKQKFFVHKAMADVEMVFHGCFGEITPASIATGAGGETGLKIIGNTIDETKNKSIVDKMLIVHRGLREYLLNTSNDSLQAMGFLKRDADIISARTGAPYCLTHTEHICCKVYIYCTAVHTSRTVSATSKCWNYYCWPVPQSPPWAEAIQESFRAVILAHTRLDEQYRKENPGRGGYLENAIPIQVRFGETYFIGD